jgi:hypothetical protein
MVKFSSIWSHCWRLELTCQVWRDNDSTSPATYDEAGQGDQIGLYFVYWVMIYFGRFLITEVDRILGCFCPRKKLWITFDKKWVGRIFHRHIWSHWGRIPFRGPLKLDGVCWVGKVRRWDAVKRLWPAFQRPGINVMKTILTTFVIIYKCNVCSEIAVFESNRFWPR